MVAIYNEIEPFVAAWLENLIERGSIPRGTVDRRDVRELRVGDVIDHRQVHFFAGIGGWSRALRIAGWPDDRPVWTGSCPCQPFSQSGHRRGFADDRHLWPVWFDLIRQCRPPIVFGEQVASPDGLRWLDAVSADLEGAGYAFASADLCAAGVGAPHIRQRLFFVAIARGQEDAQRMADVSCDGRGQRGADIGRHEDGLGSQQGQAWERSSDDGIPGIMGDTGSEGPPERPRSEVERGAVRDEGPATAETGTRSPTSGFWSGCDWVDCIDGRKRPVEPGSFPLAHGFPGRVGRVRAYGNAIVPQVAAAFITAVMQVMEARGA